MTATAAALADYSAAIRVNPRYYLAYFNRGNALQARGDLAARDRRLRPRRSRSARRSEGLQQPRLGASAARAIGSGAVADYQRALDVAPSDWS